MQLSFRLDKRPGESHLALDGKKSMANLCSWLFLLGPAPFAFCFASLLDGETQIWLGDLRVAFSLVVFVFCSGFLICRAT